MTTPTADELRHSKDVALSFFGTFFDDEDLFAMVVNALAHDVLQAAMAQPDTWGIELSAEGVLRLRIGGVDAFVIDGDESVGIAIAGAVSEQEREQLSLTVQGDGSTQPYLVSAPQATFADAWEELYERHLDALELAVDTPRAESTTTTHAPAVLEALQEIVGLAFPAPAYSTHPGAGDAEAAFETLFGDDEDDEESSGATRSASPAES